MTRQPDKTFECRYAARTGIYHLGVEGVKLIKATKITRAEAMRWVDEAVRQEPRQ